jgi:outer membrane protein assembly factor BamB
MLFAGCSGRTTGATDISVSTSRVNFTASAQLNAVGSCSEHCSFFMRWRRIGASTWTNGPTHSVGAIGRTRWSVTAEDLSPFDTYEYQQCGKEDSWSQVVCVGPDGTPNTTDKFTADQRSGDWSQSGYDGAHSGVTAFELAIDAGNVSKLGPAWFGLLRDATGPSIANGVVYVAGRRAQTGSGLVTAYRARCRIDGNRCRHRLWTADAGTAVTSSAPAITFNQVVVGSEDGKLYAFNRADGSPAWTASTGGPIRSSPTYASGLIYVGSEDGKVYAFPSSCTSPPCAPLWKTPTFGPITSSPANDPLPGQGGGRVFAGSADHHLYAFHAREGNVLWTGLTGGPIRSSPTVSNGVVYVGSDDGKLYAFQADCVTQQGTCRPSWTATTGGPITASPAVKNADFGETVYFGSTDGRLYAYSASCDVCSQAGELQWTAATGGPITTRPAVANGVVYVASGDGKLYAFDADGCGAATCQPLFTATTAGSPASPAVAGGVVYIRDQSGVRAYR